MGGKHIEYHRPLTDFLKRNDHFKKAAFKIHDTKEGFKNKFLDSFDGLLKDEDGIKLIEDKHKTQNNNKK